MSQKSWTHFESTQGFKVTGKDDTYFLLAGGGASTLGTLDLITATNIAANYYTKTQLQNSGQASVNWGNLTGVPTTFTPAVHNHDDRYYTETESDAKYALDVNVVHKTGDEQFYGIKRSNSAFVREGDNVRIVKNPTSFTNAATATGAIVLTLPLGTGQRVVDIELTYSNYTDLAFAKIRISGYWYGTYFHPSGKGAVITANSAPSNAIFNDIKLSKDAAGNPIIIFGTATSVLPATASLVVDSVTNRTNSYNTPLVDTGYSIIAGVNQATLDTIIFTPLNTNGYTQVITPQVGDFHTHDQLLNIASTPTFGAVGNVLTNGIKIGTNYSGNKGFESSTPFYFLTPGGSFTQKVLTGGVLASNSYADAGFIPTNGVFSRGQIASGVPNGTAPFVTSSLTLNTNLNADLLDGQHGSYYAPAVVGGYVPYTGATSNVSLADKNIEFTTGVVSKTQNGIRHFRDVYHGYDVAANANKILSIKFLPPLGAVMFRIEIDFYQYANNSANYVGKLIVSFYANSPTIINATSGLSAQWSGNKPLPTNIVKIGIDASGNFAINLGDATTSWIGGWLGFRVSSVESKYTDFNRDYSKGWSHAYIADETGYTSLVTAPLIISANQDWVNSQAFATNSHTHTNKANLDTINQNLGSGYTVLFNGVSIGKFLGDAYNGFNSAVPIAFLNNSNAQTIYTGGLLISNSYADSSLIPATPGSAYIKGNISLGGNITLPNSVSSYLGGKISTKAIIGYPQTVGSFHPLIRQNTSSGNTVALGGLSDVFGFYGFYAASTTNTFDWRFVFDSNNGNVESTSAITALRFASTVPIGTAPLTVVSTTMVSNLNADYLDGQHGSYYAPKATTLAGYGITDAIPLSQKGVANGVATLDAAGLIPTTQLPSYVDDVIEAASLAVLNALPSGEKVSGKIYVALDTNKSYRWGGSSFVYITSGAVDSVNGQTGIVSLTTTNIAEGTNLYYTNARVKTYGDTQWSLLGHNHAGVYEPVFTKNTAFNKNFGSAAGEVAQGNDSRINNGQTAFGWGNHNSQGYLTSIPFANTQERGGGYLWDDTPQDVDPESIYAINGQTYAVQLNNSGQLVVNVPWEDTYNTYSSYVGTGVGLVPSRPGGGTTTKYLREDGNWVVPPVTAPYDQALNTFNTPFFEQVITEQGFIHNGFNDPNALLTSDGGVIETGTEFTNDGGTLWLTPLTFDLASNGSVNLSGVRDKLIYLLNYGSTETVTLGSPNTNTEGQRVVVINYSGSTDVSISGLGTIASITTDEKFEFVCVAGKWIMFKNDGTVDVY